MYMQPWAVRTPPFNIHCSLMYFRSRPHELGPSPSDLQFYKSNPLPGFARARLGRGDKVQVRRARAEGVWTRSKLNYGAINIERRSTALPFSKAFSGPVPLRALKSVLSGQPEIGVRAFP